MKRDNKIIIGIAIALLLTFMSFGISLIPYLNTFWNWLMEGIIIIWVLIILWFIISFKKFQKEQKKKGS
jgi:predicted tellurium resistance membrane protein TerC